MIDYLFAPTVSAFYLLMGIIELNDCENTQIYLIALHYQCFTAFSWSSHNRSGVRDVSKKILPLYASLRQTNTMLEARDSQEMSSRGSIGSNGAREQQYM